MATAREARKALGFLRLPLGPRVPAPAAGRAWLASAPMVVAAIVVALGPGGQAARALGAVGLVLVGGALHAWLARRVTAPRAWLVVDDRGLRRLESGKETRLVDWADAFGATVLGRADRGAFALALTSATATRFVPVRVAGRADAASAPMLLDRAATAAESDLVADASTSLSAADAERLLHAIAARAPGALDRVHLVDAAGELVVLDRAELRVGSRRVDLRGAPRVAGVRVPGARRRGGVALPGHLGAAR